MKIHRLPDQKMEAPRGDTVIVSGCGSLTDPETKFETVAILLTRHGIGIGAIELSWEQAMEVGATLIELSAEIKERVATHAPRD